MGNGLGSVAFFPEVFDAKTTLPTSTLPFYFVNSISDTKGVGVYHKADWFFIDQLTNLGNDVELTYRLNPADVYMGKAGLLYTYVAHKGSVVTRAAVEGASPFFAKSTAKKAGNIITALNDGLYTDTVRLADSYAHSTTDQNFTLAAMKAYQGTEAVVSDYIVLRAQELNVEIVDESSRKPFYTVNKSMAMTDGKETSAYVKNFVDLDDPYNFPMTYTEDTYATEQLVLSDHVVLANQVDKQTDVEALGYEGRVSYKYYLPEFKAEDDEAKLTEQQEYVELTDPVKGIVKFNKENGYKVSTVGKEPVVRVDAFIDETLVARSYIKILIVDKEVVVKDRVIDPVRMDEWHACKGAWLYSKLTAERQQTAGVLWQNASHNIYDAANVKAEKFWDYYGGASEEYTWEVTATSTGKTLLPNGEKLPDLAATGVGYAVENGAAPTMVVPGVWIRVNKTVAGEENSSADIFVDREALTDISYVGGKYSVKITIKDDSDPKEHGDVVLVYDFTITEDCAAYKMNVATWYTKAPWIDAIGHVGQAVKYDDKEIGTVIVSGKNNETTGGVYVWEGLLINHFDRNATTGKNIFTDLPTNAKSVTFEQHDKVNVLELDPANAENTMVAPVAGLTIDGLMERDTLTYVYTFYNDEVHPRDYSVTIVNPFQGGKDAAAVAQYDGVLDKAVVDIEPLVYLMTSDITKDNDGKNLPVVVYDETSETLVWAEWKLADGTTSSPVERYALPNVFDAGTSVEYSINKDKGDAKELVRLIGAEIDATNGLFTVIGNNGNNLIGSYDVYVDVKTTIEVGGVKTISYQQIVVTVKGSL